ncbi:MAG: ribbon-helix-helix protein, CopG family [Caldilineaceae bacterium]|nr:ribbon-helix-helix protein, CopG family [Caldilineaceae bacterium]
MVRTQIQLTEEQTVQLRLLAAHEGLSVAEIIRRSVDLYLRSRPFVDLDERKRNALSIAGKYSSGLTDISENHDMYLAETHAEVEE